MSDSSVKKISEHVEARDKVHALRLPADIYAAVQVNNGSIEFAEVARDPEESLEYTDEVLIKDPHEGVLSLLRTEAKKRNIKYVAVEVNGEKISHDLVSKLWLGEDIVPYINQGKQKDNVKHLAREVSSLFNEDNSVYVQIKENNEVDVSELIKLSDYEGTVPGTDFDLLKKLSKEFKGKTLTFINATPQGGGVALMRHALIRLYKLLGVDAHWYVLYPKKEAFDITKTKFHNVLQGVAAESVVLTDDDKKIYNDWQKENAEKFSGVIKSSHVIVIDDPQPSGLIPHIKALNPKARIIYRSHIQILGTKASEDGTSQRNTWSFIWENARLADLFVSHPIREFIPKDVPKEKIVYMPATTDPLDGLNKPLNDKQMDYYMKLFNKLTLDQDQTLLDKYRPFIVQIARFDPSKGIPDVIESYHFLRQKLQTKKEVVVPQLVIAGNASIDDPDGIPIYDATLELLRSKKYAYLKDDVKVVRLPHVDQLLNALLRKSSIVLQLSIREGFEIKVTEALMKGKPVIAYRTGGIPLQIEERVNGYLAEVGDTEQVSEYLYDLCTNERLYENMSRAAEEFASKDFLTVTNAMDWLFLSLQLLRGNKIDGQYAWVKDLVYAKAQSSNSFSRYFPIMSTMIGIMAKFATSIKQL